MKTYKELTAEEKLFLSKLHANSNYPLQPNDHFFLADPETAEAIIKKGGEMMKEIRNKMKEIYIILTNIPYGGYESPFNDEYYTDKALADKICEDLNNSENSYGETYVFTLKLRKEL